MTRDSRYLPLDLDSLMIFTTDHLTKLGGDGRYPPKEACGNAFNFVYAQVLLVAFCASMARSGVRVGGLEVCDVGDLHSCEKGVVRLLPDCALGRCGTSDH